MKKKAQSKFWIQWILSIVAAAILLQTLFFKFTAAPESVAIFTQLGVEPWGRILTGILELIVGIGLLIPKTRKWSAVGAMVIMVGALGSHLFVLGFAGPNGSLALLAFIVLVCSLIVYLFRK